MGDEQKEYIVTKIEKYDEISQVSSKGIFINTICVIVFLMMVRINIPGLSDNLAMDIKIFSSLGFITATTFDTIQSAKTIYAELRKKLLIKKLRHYDIDIEKLLINEESKKEKNR